MSQPKKTDDRPAAAPDSNMLISPRLHLFEINDQSWWPQFLRESVQDVLTYLWTSRHPPFTTTSPAAHAARTLLSTLGPRISDYVYVDFASGAGGPTPYLEQKLNRTLTAQGQQPVKFVLSDLKPHLAAWAAAAQRSKNLSYMRQGVDAADAPGAEMLLRDVEDVAGKKVMRLFSLAFHHFDDELAGRILKNTVETSDGFCILELQSRHISSLLTVSLIWPVLMLTSWYRFRHSPLHLLFTYLIPLIPFVAVFDGYVSSLRTRTPDEVQALMRRSVGEERLRKEGWTFRSGWEMHTIPVGWMNWIVCTKDGPGAVR